MTDIKMFRGVVEDNVDPEKIGRVQVRIFGIHTPNNENAGESFEFIKTADLPWSEVAGGTGMGLVGGVGLSSVLRKGTTVWVLLEHGDPNKAVVIGTVTGINSESSVGKASGGEGFYDPDEVYPFVARAEETDINRLARGENLADKYYDEMSPVLALDTTLHQQIMDTLDIVEVTDTVDAEDSQADVTQTEPDSTSDLSVYPDNSVIETQSGHIIEFDDTVGNERVRLIHRTGSYFEIKPDGTFVQKSVDEVGESHYIHMSNVSEHIKMSVKRYIDLNVDEIIGGYVKKHIIGTLDEHIIGAVGRKLDATLDEHIIGAVTKIYDGNVVWNIGGTLDINTTGGITIDGATIDLTATTGATLNGGTTLGMSATTGATLDGGTTVDVTGTLVNLN